MGSGVARATTEWRRRQRGGGSGTGDAHHIEVAGSDGSSGLQRQVGALRAAWQSLHPLLVQPLVLRQHGAAVALTRIPSAATATAGDGAGRRSVRSAPIGLEASGCVGSWARTVNPKPYTGDSRNWCCLRWCADKRAAGICPKDRSQSLGGTSIRATAGTDSKRGLGAPCRRTCRSKVSRGCFGRGLQFSCRPSISRACHVARAQCSLEAFLPAAVQVGTVAPAAC